MSLTCPICAHRLSETEAYCPGCGFPAALHPEALAIAGEPESAASNLGGMGKSTPSRRTAPGNPHSRDQTHEACARSAAELSGHLRLLGLLGGNAQTFLGEMRQAALVQAEGKPAESLDLLRSAETRAARDVAELFDRRSQELEARATALSKQGIQPELQNPIRQMQAALSESRRDEAARLVIEADRQLGSLEQDLRGLHGLLEQIEQLREGARAAGAPIPEVDADLVQIRDLLGRPKVDAEVLDSAAQVAARALMMLHEALPPLLEADLDRHGSVLSTYSPEHEGAQRAKALHSDATRHLRRGRLVDAATRTAQLRKVLAEIESAPPPRRVEPAPKVPMVVGAPAERPTPVGGDPLPRLLGKARTLATRVRALPPDSELAFEAAAEIRRATELLKARKLDEADGALTRLMRALDSEPEGEN